MAETKEEFAARADRRLREEKTIWLTTVDESGAPRPAPVWFVYDGERIVVYSHHAARRLRNIPRNPRVSLNLNCDEWGGEVVYVHGTARVAPELPPLQRSEAYLAKYRDQIERDSSWNGLEGFAALYSVPVEIGSLVVRAPW